MRQRFNRDRTRSFGLFVWQRFIDDKCFETAGALAYTTLVSLVPLTVAVFAMFSAFPVFQPARDTLVNFAFANFVPAAGEAVQNAMLGFADNASKLTGISILVMLFSALAMMISIEDRLNRIWRVHAPRSWGSRILLYWAALTLGPILVVSTIAITSYVTAIPLLHGAVGQVGAVAQSLLTTLPFLVMFFTLWLMYTGIPNCAVPRRDAAIGALLGAVLFEVARWGFSVFVRHAQSYQQIYGVLAAIPILLLWIYLSWVIVILSASIAASTSAFEYEAPTRGLPVGAEFLGLLVVLRHFVDAQRSGDRVNVDGIREAEPYLRSTLIDDYLDDLQEANLIEPNEAGEWLLVRSLDSADLLRVYEHSSYRLPLRPLEAAAALDLDLPPALLALLAELAEILTTRLGARLEQVYPQREDISPDATEISA